MKLNLHGFLGEVIPALMAAGLSEQDIRTISAKTQQTVGAGGDVKTWISAMALHIPAYGETAMRAFELALREWLQTRPTDDKVAE